MDGDLPKQTQVLQMKVVVQTLAKAGELVMEDQFPQVGEQKKMMPMLLEVLEVDGVTIINQEVEITITQEMEEEDSIITIMVEVIKSLNKEIDKEVDDLIITVKMEVVKEIIMVDGKITIRVMKLVDGKITIMVLILEKEIARKMNLPVDGD